MNPDFHRRLRCSLPELNLLANLCSKKKLQTDQKLPPPRTCAPVEDSQGACRGDGGRGSHTSPSPPSSPPPLSLPSLGMQVDPAPVPSTASLHPPWHICTNQRSPLIGTDRYAFPPFRCSWIEDNVVNGLYQLQLNYAFHLDSYNVNM